MPPAQYTKASAPTWRRLPPRAEIITTSGMSVLRIDMESRILPNKRNARDEMRADSQTGILQHGWSLHRPTDIYPGIWPTSCQIR